MRRFRFRLQTVRDYRLLQLELEEAQLQALFEERRRLEWQLASCEAAREEAEKAVLYCAEVDSQQLEALDTHRRHLAARKHQLLAARADCERRITAQREAVRIAERNLELLERLKARRLAEWQREFDKELETLASESFLSRWRRP